jgi:hypothetical protein
MNKLIGCAAAGALLLAMGMGGPASARGSGHGGGHGGHGGGGGGGGWGGSSYSTSAIGSGSSVFRSNAAVVGGSPVFRSNAAVVGGSPVFRGNYSAFRRGDRDGDRVRHHRRFIGPGVFAYDAYPDYYFDDGSAYTDDNGDCGYVWVRRNGVPHRVYTCQ